MQTLNPTGFNWNNLRASFYDQILTPLDPDNKIGLRNSDRVMLRELQQNYRSNQTIVHFSNIVHLWRTVLFNINDLQPQIAWWQDQDKIAVQKGIINQNITVPELKNIANEDVMFVLPCEEGGESEFWSNSPELQSIFPSSAEQKCPPNVYSSAGVKGMEFAAVVVCGFGEYFAQVLNNKELEVSLNIKEKLTLEYFLNKRYVAVSSPTKVLGIIDTKSGDHFLWQSVNKKKISQWLEQLSNQQRQAWETQLETNGLEDKFFPHVFQDGNPLELAENLMREGLDQENRRFLESAVYYYERANLDAEAEYCSICSAKLNDDDPNFQEVGAIFMDLRGLTDSWRGDKNYQSKAGQAFQGVELKKIEG